MEIKALRLQRVENVGMNLLYISHVPKISLEDTSFSKALRKTLME
jgi:hypothetical protein